MTNQHPIIPPSELVRHWSRFQGDTDREDLWFRIAREAAQWGADQELEACCEWLEDPCTADMPSLAKDLRYSRRPKPPSLKEQALEALVSINSNFHVYGSDIETIRRALETLDD